jgi:hypothetical protein
MDAKKSQSVISGLLAFIIVLFLFMDAYPVSGMGRNAAAQVAASPTIESTLPDPRSCLQKTTFETLHETIWKRWAQYTCISRVGTVMRRVA